MWRIAVPVSLLVLAVGCSSDDDGGDNVPAVAYCDDAAGWDPAYADLEDQVLDLVNQRRSEGADCGSQGSFAATSALTMNGALRCAARVHSKDMSDRNFFDHTNPDQEDPFDRMDRAGYVYSFAGENIAVGYPTADAVMDGWMGSDGHCSNIMNPNYTEIGVGYYDGAHWTQTFGRP